MAGIEKIEEKLAKIRSSAGIFWGQKKSKLNFNKFKGRPKVTDIQKKMLKWATEEISLSVKEGMPWP